MWQAASFCPITDGNKTSVSGHCHSIVLGSRFVPTFHQSPTCSPTRLLSLLWSVLFLIVAYQLFPFHPLAEYPDTIISKMLKARMAHITSKGQQYIYYQAAWGGHLLVNLYIIFYQVLVLTNIPLERIVDLQHGHNSACVECIRASEGSKYAAICYSHYLLINHTPQVGIMGSHQGPTVRSLVK